MIRFRALALLILFSVSTIGNAIDVHYCQGQFTEIALYGDIDCCCASLEVEHKSCHQEEAQKCHVTSEQNKSENKIAKKDCCETATIEMIGDNDFTSANPLSIPLAIILVHFNPFLFQEPTIVSDKDLYYCSPFRVRNIPILNQSFLI